MQQANKQKPVKYLSIKTGSYEELMIPLWSMADIGAILSHLHDAKIVKFRGSNNENSENPAFKIIDQEEFNNDATE